MSSRYKPWNISVDLPPFFGSASVVDEHGCLTVILQPPRRHNEALKESLWIRFDRFAAYMVHEEFSHPSVDEEAHPENEWPRPHRPSDATGPHYAFPCLIVDPSPWKASFSPSRLIGLEKATHYFFWTLGNFVDVLGNDPRLEWKTANDIRLDLERHHSLAGHPYLTEATIERLEKGDATIGASFVSIPMSRPAPPLPPPSASPLPGGAP